MAARLERQRLLYAGERRFQVVLEEQALRTRVGGIQTMAGQLDRLITLMSLQRVSLARHVAQARRPGLIITEAAPASGDRFPSSAVSRTP